MDARVGDAPPGQRVDARRPGYPAVAFAPMAEPGDLDFDALREHLAASRRRGQAFDHAWQDAGAGVVVEAGAGAGGGALSSTRWAGGAAYERRPPQRQHGVLDALGRTLHYEPDDAEYGRSAL